MGSPFALRQAQCPLRVQCTASHDVVDNDTILCAEEINHELQHLAIGHVIGEEVCAMQASEPKQLLLLGYTGG